MTFRYFSFDVGPITSDAIMMIYEIWIRPLDVMIINRIANMTSVDGATQLVHE